MDTTGKEISAGNAAKLATDITLFAYQNGLEEAGINQILDTWAGVHAVLTNSIIATTEQATGTPATPAFAVAQPSIAAAVNQFPTAVPQPAVGPFDAQASIQNHFPGTTVVAPPATAVAQFPQAVTAPVGPAPIPGVAVAGVDPEVEEAFKVFFNDIAAGTFANNWEDNRQKKAEGGKFAKIPDFKHKTWQKPGAKYPVGVYLNDKKAPAWVADQLRAVGLAA